VSRIVETLVPRRLGVGFRWLLGSSWASNLGDGILLAVGPLLVASLTEDAWLVALAATLQWLPPLVFGLFAGALSDRLDRASLEVDVATDEFVHSVTDEDRSLVYRTVDDLAQVPPR